MNRVLLAILVLCLAAGAAMAQPKKPATASRPAWAELTVEQQKVLSPLKTDWDALDRERKLKWIGIAKRYPAMKPAEQARVQKRMQTWAKLTPEQRRQARETYKQLAKQPPEQRGKLRDKWAEYQRQQPAPAPRELPEAPDSAKEAAEAESSDAPTIPASPGH
ncbi:MAG TPA: DUF3106 domain-containing protein [Burkholderiales bacterium]